MTDEKFTFVFFFLVPFSAVYHAIYLEELTAAELTEKIAQLFNISPRQINQIFKQGPTGIHVLVSDEVKSCFYNSPSALCLYQGYTFKYQHISCHYTAIKHLLSF